jgi:hypothetical protein
VPKALDPEATFDVVLKSDRDKPEAERPTFVYRHLNGREWRNLATLNDQFVASPGGNKSLDCIYEAVSIGLVGWRNMIDPKTGEPIAFSVENIDLVLDPFEADEITAQILSAGMPSPGEGNGSESPSSSGTGSCADSAAPADA